MKGRPDKVAQYLLPLSHTLFRSCGTDSSKFDCPASLAVRWLVGWLAKFATFVGRARRRSHHTVLRCIPSHACVEPLTRTTVHWMQHLFLCGTSTGTAVAHCGTAARARAGVFGTVAAVAARAQAQRSE
jgi:hypothetical protein